MNIKEYLLKARQKLSRSKDKAVEDVVSTTDENVIDVSDTTIQEDAVLEAPKSFVSEKLDEILDKESLEFFPKNGNWYSNCFRRPEEVNMGNLPCHLRDDEWLAKMFRKDRNLVAISSSYILDYVKNSSFFKEARHNYELEIVKWQINWMRNGGENWIIDEELGGDFFEMSNTADLAFRKGVVDTLTKIGMDPEVVEEGIEKNASLWRDRYMERSFSNEYDSFFLTFEFNLFGEKKEEDDSLNKPTLPDIDKDFKEGWMKLRRYEYYQRHKSSVDKYGAVLPEMLLAGEELVELKDFVNLKAEERKADIEEYKAQKERFNQKRKEKRYK